MLQTGRIGLDLDLGRPAKTTIDWVQSQIGLDVLGVFDKLILNVVSHGLFVLYFENDLFNQSDCSLCRKQFYQPANEAVFM